MIPINGLTPEDPSLSVISCALYFIIGNISPLKPLLVFIKTTGLLLNSKLFVESCAPIIDPFGVIVKDPVTPDPTRVIVSPLVYPNPGLETYTLVTIPETLVPTPTLPLPRSRSPPQYPEPWSVRTILFTAPFSTITFPVAPSPWLLLSKIVIEVELLYPLPPFKTSTENIDLSIPTIGLTIAPVPSPLITAAGGIHCGCFTPIGNVLKSSCVVGLYVLLLHTSNEFAPFPKREYEAIAASIDPNPPASNNSAAFPPLNLSIVFSSS